MKNYVIINSTMEEKKNGPSHQKTQNTKAQPRRNRWSTYTYNHEKLCEFVNERFPQKRNPQAQIALLENFTKYFKKN